MTENDLNRREFVRACALALATGADFKLAPRLRMQDALRIAFAARNTEGSAARGVTLGVEEAARTGELVGRRVELVTADSLEGAAHLAVDRWPAALIGGFDEAQCEALVELAHRTGVLVMNVGCRADHWRSSACERNAFHIEASDSMYADALAARGEDGEVPASAALWHPSLERFGAAQLNNRFRARFGAEMDGAAWAGWMAVKVLWESSLRARTTERAGLRRYMESGLTRFDGHKGWPLSFRAWNHQLRQPLYLVGGPSSRLVGEVPTRRAGEESSSPAMLDLLGGRDLSAAVCRMDW